MAPGVEKGVSVVKGGETIEASFSPFLFLGPRCGIYVIQLEVRADGSRVSREE